MTYPNYYASQNKAPSFNPPHSKSLSFICSPHPKSLSHWERDLKSRFYIFTPLLPWEKGLGGEVDHFPLGEEPAPL